MLEIMLLFPASVDTAEEGGARDKGTCSSIVLEFSGVLGKQQQQQAILFGLLNQVFVCSLISVF
jgi:hypothetical protein